MSGAGAVRAFDVWSSHYPDYVSTVLARSAGAAKYSRWLDMKESIPDMPITAMRARVLDRLVEPRGFRRCVEGRAIPFARVGMRVRLGDGASARMGTIVGHNASANLDVLLDGDSAPSNCHPWWQLTYFNEHGEAIPHRPCPWP